MWNIRNVLEYLGTCTRNIGAVGYRAACDLLEGALVAVDGLAHGLDEVVVAGDLRGDHGELVPLVALQHGQHRGGLVLQRGRQLQLQAGASGPLDRQQRNSRSEVRGRQ